MNDALVLTSPRRCMFKWMGLNLTTEMTGHSFFFFWAGGVGTRGRLHEWSVVTRGSMIDAPGGRASESVAEDERKAALLPCLERLEDPGGAALSSNLTSAYPL